MAKEADFDEFERFVKNFENAQKEFDVFLKKYLLEMALRAIADAKKNTPEDTGALRAMWGIDAQKLVVKTSTGGKVSIDPEKSEVASVKLVGNNFEVMIWNGMDYASFVEYGARTVGGGWREGHFMLTIAVDKVQKQMPARFQKSFKEFIEQRKVG